MQLICNIFITQGCIRRQPVSYFKELNKLFWNGRLYPVPIYPDEWLEMRCGSDWKTPKTYKGDWKDDCFDI